MQNKVGIATFTFGDNFGQRLQNYAVQEYLINVGFIPYTLKIKGKYEDPISRFKYFIKENYSLKQIYLCLKRSYRFIQFNNRYIRFYNKKRRDSFSEKEFRDFSFLVAGSDQVWNPNSHAVNSNYFLTFVNKEKRKSFAASFSVENLPVTKRELYKNYLEGFQCITVREKSAIEIIKNIAGIDASLICDPTLLFDNEWWSKIERIPNNMISGKYILEYFLGNCNDQASINVFAQEKGYDIVNLNLDGGFYDIGPCEFIYLIHHAEYVFTDSYHGMLFCLQFKRPFKNLNRVDSNISMNSRFETVFSVLDIKEDDIRDTDIHKSIDYSKISMNIKKFRDSSLQILADKLK